MGRICTPLHVWALDPPDPASRPTMGNFRFGYTFEDSRNRSTGQILIPLHVWALDRPDPAVKFAFRYTLYRSTSPILREGTTTEFAFRIARAWVKFSYTRLGRLGTRQAESCERVASPVLSLSPPQLER